MHLFSRKLQWLWQEPIYPIIYSRQQYRLMQVQFHAKYPLFDSQSDRDFTFSYAILYEVLHLQSFASDVISDINKLSSFAFRTYFSHVCERELL